MEPLHVLHLVLVSLWGGVVLAETVLELCGGGDEAARRTVARVHYWNDLLVEIPLLVAVLATGAVLAARAWPLTWLHWVKIGAALVAVATNLYASAMVVARHRAGGDAAAIRRYTTRIRLSGVGVPFAVVAAYIGVSYFLR
jgi:hypothetical protein